MTSLSQLVERVRGRLNQYTVNRPQLATFGGLTGTSMTLTPAAGYNTLGGPFVVEIGSELIQCTGFDSATNIATVPAWGRAQLGTSQTTLTNGDRAVVNPIWPYWHTAQSVIDGMKAMYPILFAVKNVTLTSTILDEKYVLPSDFEDVLDIRVEWFAPTNPQRPVTTYTVDVSQIDGARYLYMPALGMSGRNIFITYKAVPTYPTGPADGTWTWETSGFPTTADDLPVLHAATHLVMAAETSRLQNFSSEQSDRARFIQGGTANAASRRFDELFQARLLDERNRLMDRYPPHFRRQFVG